MRRFIKYPNSYVKAAFNYESPYARKALRIQARDFCDIDVTSLKKQDVVSVGGLDWRLYYVERYPRAIKYNFINDDTGRTITITKTPGHPEWLRMSSFDSSLNADVAADAILNSNKPCVYTHGISYRHPTTYRVPISKDKAIDIIYSAADVVDVEEEADVFHINTLSGNDLL